MHPAESEASLPWKETCLAQAQLCEELQLESRTWGMHFGCRLGVFDSVGTTLPPCFDESSLVSLVITPSEDRQQNSRLGVLRVLGHGMQESKTQR